MSGCPSLWSHPKIYSNNIIEYKNKYNNFKLYEMFNAIFGTVFFSRNFTCNKIFSVINCEQIT